MTSYNTLSKLRRWLAALLLVTLLVPPSLQANEFREGLNAYLDGDYETAYATWHPLAEAGHAASQHGLGTLYSAGRGIAQDHRKATEWFRRAAEQGHPAAQFSLGNAYRSGRGAPRDDTQAAKWWEKAAEQGFGPAQASLGTLQHARDSSVSGKEGGPMRRRKAAGSGSAIAPEPVARNLHNDARPVTAALRRDWISPISRRAADADPHKTGVTRGEAWLLDQNPGTYTIQLSAARSERNIRRFASTNGLSNEAAYFRLQKQGEIWYSLLYGIYSDYARAKQTLDTLPANLQRSGPWIRTMASVQKAIAQTAP